MSGKKIIIVGCPGSGKSTFARALSTITGLPLYHLDLLNWNPDKTTVPKEIFRQRLHDVVQRESWIIDGNYNSTMEIRLQACDTVVFLDYPVDVCMEGIQSRFGKPREDMPWIETEVDTDFLQFVERFGAESRPKILTLFERYPEKTYIVFASREDADKYLKELDNCRQ